MPTWLLVALLVLLFLVVALALGGALANARRERRGREEFERAVADANRHLSDAYAADKGWERGTLEEAARRALEAERAGVEVRELVLVGVTDRPGVHEDQAIFHCVAADGDHRVTLARSTGDWHLERIE